MTTREHFNKIYVELEESDFSEAYCNILESDDINEIRPLIENIHGELVKEICKERGEEDFYGGLKDGLYNEWRGSEYADIDCRIGDGLKLGE